MEKSYEVAKELGVELHFQRYNRWENQPFVHLDGVDVFLISDLSGPGEIEGIEPFWALPAKWQTAEHVRRCARDLRRAHQDYGVLGGCYQDYHGAYHFSYDVYD